MLQGPCRTTDVEHGRLGKRSLVGVSVVSPYAYWGMDRRPLSPPTPHTSAPPGPLLTHLPPLHLAPCPALGPGTQNQLRVHHSRSAQLPAHPEEPGAVPTLSAHTNPKYSVTRGWHLQLHPCLRSQAWLLLQLLPAMTH